jgi:hypothetical protein
MNSVLRLENCVERDCLINEGVDVSQDPREVGC